jgi:hypothetical protein
LRDGKVLVKTSVLVAQGQIKQKLAVGYCRMLQRTLLGVYEIKASQILAKLSLHLGSRHLGPLKVKVT